MQGIASQAQIFRFLFRLSARAKDMSTEEFLRRLVVGIANRYGATACSIYRWKGKIEEEEEKLLFVKTSRRLFPQVQETIRELHSYDLPEVLAISIAAGDPAYLNWLGESLNDGS